MKKKFLLRSAKGQALILIALAAIGLFGVTGLVIDGSAKFSDRRHAQNAADTAAMAAALAKATALTNHLSNSPAVCPAATTPYSPVCDALLLAGLNRALENGYNDDPLTNNVEVYSPPISGPYMNDESYVQVIITSYVKTYFARVIGIGQTKNTVEAVALTEEGGPLGDGAMIVSYDPHPHCSSGGGSGGGSVDVSGSGTLNLDGGGIFLNSSETCGYSAPNCPTINITGGAGINSAATVDNINQSCGSIPEKLNQDPVIIPDDIYMPGEPPECNQVATAYPANGKWHITPGYYAPFPQTSLNGDIVGNKEDIVMDPGVYCVGQDIHWSGTTFDSLDGSSGVTIYLKRGVDFNLNINSPITLYAPHTGSKYDGYIVIQNGTPTSIGSCAVNGGSYLDIEGTVFAPYCDITVNGGSEPTATINAQLVGWDIKLNGNNTIDFNYDPTKVVKIKNKVGLMR